MIKVKRTFASLCLFFQFSMTTVDNSMKDTLIVNSSTGLIRGKLNVYKNLSYYSFEGIPYAESVSGEFRFKPSIPKEPWKHVLDATREGPVCPQSEKVYKLEQMKEDCLYLNIYVPANITNELLPTFVNIHGGGLSLRSGNRDNIYGPEYMLQKEVIFVSINYRLHAFGFLSVNEENACGNAGLKDIVLSLKWIKYNLKYFGGDNNKITIGGHSSGGTLVHYLMLSKKTRGLFQQAIIISGSAVHHRFLVRHPKDLAFLLAENLNIKSNDTREVVEHLRRVDPIELTEQFIGMKSLDPYFSIRPFSFFAPTIDTACTDPFIDVEPAETVKNGMPQNVPVLTGFNTNEGLYMIPYIFSKPGNIEKIRNNLEILIPSDIEYPKGLKEARDLAKSITRFYFGKNNLLDDEFCLLCLVEYITDIQNTVYSTDRWIRVHKRRKESNNLYLYEFNFDGMLNWAKDFYNISFAGVAHADELGYLFRTETNKHLEDRIDSRTTQMLETMITLFTDFIKYGNPTPPHKINHINDIIWPEYGKEQNFLIINDKLRVAKRGDAAKTAKMNFWDKVYEDYYNYIRRGGQLAKKIIP